MKPQRHELEQQIINGGEIDSLGYTHTQIRSIFKELKYLGKVDRNKYLTIIKGKIWVGDKVENSTVKKIYGMCDIVLSSKKSFYSPYLDSVSKIYIRTIISNYNSKKGSYLGYVKGQIVYRDAQKYINKLTEKLKKLENENC